MNLFCKKKNTRLPSAFGGRGGQAGESIADLKADFVIK